jgi:hypothetical protein
MNKGSKGWVFYRVKWQSAAPWLPNSSVFQAGIKAASACASDHLRAQNVVPVRVLKEECKS